jgi:hypothetical protein
MLPITAMTRLDGLVHTAAADAVVIAPGRERLGRSPALR